MAHSTLYIGLMSGTSLDGVDGVLADFGNGAIHTLAAAFVPFPPALPDLSGYTVAAMEKKIVKSKPGKISIRRMMQEDALKDFIGGDNKMAEWVVRQHGIPQAIFVDDGYMNLKDLLEMV